MKAILQYTAMVGIPVLIVVGLLRSCEHFLRAPAEPDRFQGTLTVASCGATISLNATRRPERHQTSGGH